MELSDSFFGPQHGGGHGGFDMNIIPAWKDGYTGQGIVISILDDGIEKDHPDLVKNYVSCFFFFYLHAKYLVLIVIEIYFYIYSCHKT